MKSTIALNVLAVALFGILGASVCAQSVVPLKGNLTVENLKKSVKGKPAPTTNQAALEASLTPQSSNSSQSLFQTSNPANASSTNAAVSPVLVSPSLNPDQSGINQPLTSPQNNNPQSAPVYSQSNSNASSASQVKSNSEKSEGLSGIPFQFNDPTENTLSTIGSLQAQLSLQKLSLDVDKQIQARKDFANGVTRGPNGALTSPAGSGSAASKTLPTSASAAPAAPRVAGNPRVTSVYSFGDRQFAEVVMDDGTKYVANPGTKLPGGYRVGKVHDGGVEISNHGHANFYPVQAGLRAASSFTGQGVPQSTALPASSLASPSLPPVALPPMPAGQ